MADSAGKYGKVRTDVIESLISKYKVSLKPEKKKQPSRLGIPSKKKTMKKGSKRNLIQATESSGSKGSMEEFLQDLRSVS